MDVSDSHDDANDSVVNALESLTEEAAKKLLEKTPEESNEKPVPQAVPKSDNGVEMEVELSEPPEKPPSDGKKSPFSENEEEKSEAVLDDADDEKSTPESPTEDLEIIDETTVSSGGEDDDTTAGRSNSFRDISKAMNKQLLAVRNDDLEMTFSEESEVEQGSVNIAWDTIDSRPASEAENEKTTLPQSAVDVTGKPEQEIEPVEDITEQENKSKEQEPISEDVPRASPLDLGLVQKSPLPPVDPPPDAIDSPMEQTEASPELGEPHPELPEPPLESPEPPREPDISPTPMEEVKDEFLEEENEENYSEKDKASEEKEKTDELEEDVEEIEKIVEFIQNSAGVSSANEKSENVAAEIPYSKKKKSKKSKVKSDSSKKSKKKKPQSASKPPLEEESKSSSKSPIEDTPSKRSSVTRHVTSWKKVIRLPHSQEDRQLDEQVFRNCLPSYVPCVPKGTSDRLIAALTERELEQLSCPGCRDRFLIPTSFFQHLYRKSVMITFNCTPCDKVLSFHNRCHLRTHVLSHLEIDGTQSIATDNISVLSLPIKDLNVGFTDDTFEEELSRLHNEHMEGRVQCTECRTSVDDMADHFASSAETSFAKNSRFECSQCQMLLPSRCALSAHERVHRRLKPFVCPECTVVFETWDIFRNHVQRTCRHESKVLCLTCRICKSGMVESESVLSHIYGSHVRLYYKCTGCPRAFAGKAEIYAHGSGEHWKQKQSQADFTLLYKAPFLSAKQGNLFNSREAFETRMQVVLVKWPSRFMFKCYACLSYFPTADELATHNSDWCKMKYNIQRIKSKLFQDAGNSGQIDHYNKLAEHVSGLEGASSDCDGCQKLAMSARSHLDKSHVIDPTPIPSSPEGFDPCRRTRSQSTADPDPPPPEPRVRRLKNEPEEVHIKVELITDENASLAAAVKRKRSSGRLASSEKTKRSRKHEPKPFVEQLGLDVLEAKRILKFNHVKSKAFLLGSTVRAPKTRSEFNCGLCDFSSDFRESLQSHIRVHRPNKSAHFLQCKECGMCFAAEPSWRKHLFLLHRIKRPNPEDYCADLRTPSTEEQAEETEAPAEVSEEAASGEEDPYDFDDSGSDSERLVIDTDRDTSTASSRKNICTVCSRSFSTPLELRKHFRGHGMAYLMDAKKP